MEVTMKKTKEKVARGAATIALTLVALGGLVAHTRIGSITKTFTGTLIMQLVAQGKLQLSDTIDRWFPWVPNASQITVRELGDMSSGINNYTADPPFLERYFGDPQTVWTRTPTSRCSGRSPKRWKASRSPS
jgi:CubicO group peptidase (beta-lactamase class C family)